MVKKQKLQIAIFLNVLIVIFEMIGIVIMFKKMGLELFKYYTEDSNILSCLASIVFIYFGIRALKNNNEFLPKSVSLFRYIVTICLTLTFVVVMTVLIPTGGPGAVKNLLYVDAGLYHHVLCPVLSFVSLILFEDAMQFSVKKTLLGMIPTVIYGIIIVILNIAKVLVGPYIFLHVYEQSVLVTIMWIFVLFGSAWIFALVILKLCSRNRSKI